VGVKGRGHGHPDEAWEGKNVSMDVDVLEWSDSGLDNVEIKGQYFLQVNKNRFDFSREACTTIQATNVLLLTTNYRAASSSGWRIDHITDENDISPVDWLTVTAPNGSKNAGAYGPPDTEAQLVLTYTQNTTGQPRYAKIVFAAGRLRYTVNVVQDIREGVSITFYSGSGKIVDGVLVPDGHVIDTLKFHYPTSPYVNQEAQSFTITWTPKEADVRLFETHKYVQPINGISRFLNIKTNPPNFRVITSHSGVFVLSVGLEYLHTEENRQAMYYAQSAIGFYVSNGVEEIEKYIVFVCYPPN
jgi:hypothetical protein